MAYEARDVKSQLPQPGWHSGFGQLNAKEASCEFGVDGDYLPARGCLQLSHFENRQAFAFTEAIRALIP